MTFAGVSGLMVCTVNTCSQNQGCRKVTQFGMSEQPKTPGIHCAFDFGLIRLLCVQKLFTATHCFWGPHIQLVMPVWGVTHRLKSEL